MIRKLMASCAIAALTSAGAITLAQAQTDPAQPVIVEEQPAAATDNATTTAPATEQAASEDVLTPDRPTLASVFVGRSVYSSADPESDNIGDVNDLIVSEEGTITHAVVGVGGFLGIGEKDVAVPFDELEVVERDGDIRLVYAASREQLESAPALDRTAYDPMARFQEQQSASIDTSAPIAPTAPVDTTAEAPAPVEAPATDMAAAPAEPPAAEAPAGDVVAETPVEPAAPADQMAAETPAEPAVSETAPPMDSDLAFTATSADQVRASTLLGKSVLGPDDQSIGEVSDLVLQEDGATRVALIDVGGFLGVGEKTVAIPFEEFTFTKTDEAAEPQVKVAMTKEQLEQLPAFDTAALETAAVEKPPTADTTTAPATDPAAPDMAAAPATPSADDITTGSVNATQNVAASKLMGAGVYGADDASIGEVSDIVFAPQGEIEAVIVDVGGFLGIGEKPVALNFEKLNIQTDEGGTMKVSVNATKEQLDQAPQYQVTLQ